MNIYLPDIDSYDLYLIVYGALLRLPWLQAQVLLALLFVDFFWVYLKQVQSI
jgi:hypothetical protein